MVVSLENRVDTTTATTSTGWIRYVDSESADSVTFEHPSEWTLTKYENSYGEPPGYVLTGDGYQVVFTPVDNGFPIETYSQVSERTVAGEKVKAIENKASTGFYLSVGEFCETYAAQISSPEDAREVTDRILNSVRCSRQ